MIICSSCHFENPSHHRYCQHCGGSLPDVAEMDQELYAAEHNPLQAADTGVSYSDLVSPLEPMHHFEHNSLAKSGSNRRSLEHDPEHTRLAILPTLPSWWQSQNVPPYIDPQQRYQILSIPLLETRPANVSARSITDVEIVLLDRFADTLVDGLTDADPDSPNLHLAQDEKVVDSLELAAPLASHGADINRVQYSNTQNGIQHDDASLNPRANQGGDAIALEPEPSFEADTTVPVSQSVPDGEASTANILTTTVIETSSLESDQETVYDSSMGVSDEAQQHAPETANDSHLPIYLALQDLLYPSFPRIMDTLDDRIVILENRDPLTPLYDAIAQPDIVVPQILHWFHEMAELWEILAQHCCCTSLLTPSNIRIDEDQIICLRRLYIDVNDQPSGLSALGELWHHLHQRSSITWPDTLEQIYHDLRTSVIADIDILRHRLELVADKIYQETVTSDAECENSQESYWASTNNSTELHHFADMIRNADLDTTGSVFTPDLAKQSDREPALLEGEGGMAAAVQQSDNVELHNPQPNLSEDPTIVLPMQLYRLSHVGATNNGIQRDHNEDFFVIETHSSSAESPVERGYFAKGLYILCDGMGGHSAGEVASALAGETLQAYFTEHWTEQLPDAATIRDGIVLANKVLYERNQADHSEGFGRMGTTLVMLLVQNTQVAIAHVGDSRIYRFTRRQGLEQLTLDHEVGQREIGRGVDPSVAYARPDAQQLTQALGPRDQDFIRPDIKFWDMNEDSLFVLGSDGLTDNDLLENYCQSHIEPLISSSANLDEGAYNLIDLANQVNGHDNITVILVRVKLRPKLSLLSR